MATAVKKSPGLGTLVLIGFATGVFAGLFFGEMAAILSGVGRAYVRLLQMSIVPYIMVSLIAGLGRLTPKQALQIALWGGVAMALLLAIGLFIVLLAPLSYPDWPAASYFNKSVTEVGSGVDFVSLYIAANPFEALAQTLVPAIVLFSILMGVALMLSEQKKPLLDLLASLEEVLMNITQFVVRLAPFGIFAIAANAAGTLDVNAFDKLSVFVWSVVIAWALLFFIVLPGLLRALTPVGFGELFRTFRISLITALVTGSVLVVLPMMIARTREVLERHDVGDEQTNSTVEVLIPTTYNFPSVALLLVLSFVLFAGWYAGTPLEADNYAQFSIVGLFVGFGGSNIAIPFMLDMFRLPADMFELFLVANVITKFFFTSLSAMFLIVLTLLTVFLIRGKARATPGALLGLAVIVVLAVPATLKLSSFVIDRAIPYEYRGYGEFIARGLVDTDVPVREVEYDPSAELRQVSRRDRMAADGWLRVGYAPDALPWAFRNADGEVVGFDMEIVHHLAADMGVGLQLVRVSQDQVPHALASGQVDVFASGLLLDPVSATGYRASRPYSEVTLGLLVHDYRRRDFRSADDVLKAVDTTFAIVQSPSLLRSFERWAPGLKATSIETPRQFVTGNAPDVDAVVISAEAASAWTLVYPDYSAVVPTPEGIRVPLVFALPLDDEPFRLFVDNWILTAGAMGIVDEARGRWILGKETVARRPRWSIIRDVLHWVDDTP